MSDYSSGSHNYSKQSIKVWDSPRGLGVAIWRSHNQLTPSSFNSSAFFPALSGRRGLRRSSLSSDILNRYKIGDGIAYKSSNLPLVTGYHRSPTIDMVNVNSSASIVNPRYLNRAIDNSISTNGFNEFSTQNADSTASGRQTLLLRRKPGTYRVLRKQIGRDWKYSPSGTELSAGNESNQASERGHCAEQLITVFLPEEHQRITQRLDRGNHLSAKPVLGHRAQAHFGLLKDRDNTTNERGGFPTAEIGHTRNVPDYSVRRLAARKVEIDKKLLDLSFAIDSRSGSKNSRLDQTTLQFHQNRITDSDPDFCKIPVRLAATIFSTDPAGGETISDSSSNTIQRSETPHRSQHRNRIIFRSGTDDIPQNMNTNLGQSIVDQSLCSTNKLNRMKKPVATNGNLNGLMRIPLRRGDNTVHGYALGDLTRTKTRRLSGPDRLIVSPQPTTQSDLLRRDGFLNPVRNLTIPVDNFKSPIRMSSNSGCDPIKFKRPIDYWPTAGKRSEKLGDDQSVENANNQLINMVQTNKQSLDPTRRIQPFSRFDLSTLMQLRISAVNFGKLGQYGVSRSPNRSSAQKVSSPEKSRGFVQTGSPNGKYRGFDFHLANGNVPSSVQQIGRSSIVTERPLSSSTSRALSIDTDGVSINRSELTFAGRKSLISSPTLARLSQRSVFPKLTDTQFNSFGSGASQGAAFRLTQLFATAQDMPLASRFSVFADGASDESSPSVNVQPQSSNMSSNVSVLSVPQQIPVSSEVNQSETNVEELSQNGPSADVIADQVWRKLMRKLALEQERGGYRTWP